MKWVAKITSKSAVDAGSNIEITFDLYKGDVVVYPGLSVSGNPDGIEQLIRDKCTALKNQVETAETLQINQEIEI